MERWDVPDYMKSVQAVCMEDLPWDEFDGKSVLITGATGLIGTFLVDVFAERRRLYGDDIEVICVGRSLQRMRGRFSDQGLYSSFRFNEGDIADRDGSGISNADFFIHLASPTHPAAYASDPIGVIASNVRGLDVVMEAAVRSAGKTNPRVLFASSVEIYGANRGDIERFSESDLGYIDCNTPRACYSESKRLCEALCQAYRVERGVSSVVARIAHVYGPTLLPTDTKAVSQFISRALRGEDVVLKSSGRQRFSYLHVADVVSGVLRILLLGGDGEAYNFADSASDITLRELASTIAACEGVGVVFAEADPKEAAGYTPATLALMDGSKLQGLGWRARYSIGDGIAETLKIMKCLRK